MPRRQWKCHWKLLGKMKKRSRGKSELRRTFRPRGREKKGRGLEDEFQIAMQFWEPIGISSRGLPPKRFILARNNLVL